MSRGPTSWFLVIQMLANCSL